MAIIRQDPILSSMRKHLIIRMKEVKEFKEDFDYNSIEWKLSGNNHNYPVELKIRLDQDLLWIDFIIQDVDMEMTKEQIRELTEEYLLAMNAEFNDQECSDEGTWFMTYLIRFKGHSAGILLEKMKTLAERVTGN